MNPPFAFRIRSIHAREILDSRGNPTVEADVTLYGGMMGRASVPSGASTGSHEAVELRDGDRTRYGGKGVCDAVRRVNTRIAMRLRRMDARHQTSIDLALRELDNTPDKHRLGANAILAVSLAVARAAARQSRMPLYAYIHTLAGEGVNAMTLPMPMVNVLNGGAHASTGPDIQEFMIVPIGANTMADAVRMSAETYHALHKIIRDEGYADGVGDEGGFAPSLKRGNHEALELLVRAIERAGYGAGKDIAIALDVAASELKNSHGYAFQKDRKIYSSTTLIAWYEALIKEFPIVSIEDGLGENDWEGWHSMTCALGRTTLLVGDDLLVTNIKRLERAERDRAGNAILIKPNQIGTLTETIDAVRFAHRNDWQAVVSHRSGETEDALLAHLAVGLGVGRIKTGSVARGERTAKYNELLRIAEELGDSAMFAKWPIVAKKSKSKSQKSKMK